MSLWGDAWDGITSVADDIWDGVTTGVGAVFVIAEVIVSPIAGFLAFTLGFILAIPILGRIINWIINIITTVFWYVVGSIDFLLSMLGIRPEKKLRAFVIVLSDSKGPVAKNADILPVLTEFVNTFKNRANVRVIQSKPFQFTSAFADVDQPTEDWIYINTSISGDDILDVQCGTDSVKEDLWIRGAKLQALQSIKSPYHYLRSLLGYGAPVFIFIVRSFTNKYNGCSIGPLSDYVLVAGQALSRDHFLIAHEAGHSCNLTHSSAGYDYPISNLMYPEDTRTGNYLTRWQISVLRGSRHATYF